MKTSHKVLIATALPLVILWAAQVHHLKNNMVRTSERHQHQIDSIKSVNYVKTEKLETHIFKLQVELELCKSKND